MAGGALVAFLGATCGRWVGAADATLGAAASASGSESSATPTRRRVHAGDRRDGMSCVLRCIGSHPHPGLVRESNAQADVRYILPVSFPPYSFFAALAEK